MDATPVACRLCVAVRAVWCLTLKEVGEAPPGVSKGVVWAQAWCGRRLPLRGGIGVCEGQNASEACCEDGRKLTSKSESGPFTSTCFTSPTCKRGRLTWGGAWGGVGRHYGGVVPA